MDKTLSKFIYSHELYIQQASKRSFLFHVNDITSRRENTAFRIQTVYAAFLSNPWGCLAARQAGITYVIRVGRCKSRGTITIDRRFARQSHPWYPFHTREKSIHGTPLSSFVTVSVLFSHAKWRFRGGETGLERRGLKSNSNPAPGNIIFFTLRLV